VWPYACRCCCVASVTLLPMPLLLRYTLAVRLLCCVLRVWIGLLIYLVVPSCLPPRPFCHFAVLVLCLTCRLLPLYLLPLSICSRSTFYPFTGSFRLPFTTGCTDTVPCALPVPKPFCCVLRYHWPTYTVPRCLFIPRPLPHIVCAFRLHDAHLRADFCVCLIVRSVTVDRGSY